MFWSGGGVTSIARWIVVVDVCFPNVLWNKFEQEKWDRSYNGPEENLKRLFKTWKSIAENEALQDYSWLHAPSILQKNVAYGMLETSIIK